ncbi:MAG: phage tail protein [Pyrinomonadaceae bacterium]|nr:phage tail protein [Pyrinomonadaceae bacterium]
MSDPYVGEIRMFGGNFAPVGWAMCQGQLVPISQNDTLFNLIGTTYGGDGQETFGLPDLQGRAPMHQGQGPGIKQNYVIGEKAGVESVTLTTQQIPVHNHACIASTNTATATTANGNITAATNQLKIYTEQAVSKHFASGTVQPVGGSQPHENMQPYLVITFILSLYGIYPTQS